MTVARLRRTDSALLFHARYTDGVVEALTGQADSFSRSGDGYALASNGLYLRAAHSRPRFAVDVNDVVGLLLEASQENLALQAANLDDSSSPWANNSAFTIDGVASLVPGQTAHQHEYVSGGESRNQIIGTFPSPATPHTLAVLFENVNASSSSCRIWDGSVGIVSGVRYEWGTEAVTGTGTTFGSSVTRGVVELPDLGPNGGAVVLLWTTATPDNTGTSREIFGYPSGSGTTDAGDTAILHAVGLVEAAFLTSPIVTAGSSVTRVAEELAYTYNVPATKPWSGWIRFIAPPAGAPKLLRIGDSAPDVVLEVTSGGEVQVTHDNNSSTVSSVTSGLSMSQGDVVDARVRFGSDGKVTVGASVNEGAETAGSQSAALSPADWGSAELFPGGLSAEMARVILREIKVHPDPDATMAELRGA